MNIEKISCGYIEQLLARCPGLEPQIQSSDRSPFTDGHIDLHSSSPATTNNLLGRVPVQVKATSCDNGSQGRTSIRLVDLRAYAEMRGCLYLVADVDSQGEVTKLWYVVLSPFKVATLLQSAGENQKEITTSIKPFPEDCHGISALLNAAVQAKRQDPGLTVELSDLPEVTALTIVTAQELPLDRPFRLSEDDDFTLFVDSAFGRVALAGEFEMIPHSYIPSTRAIPFSAGPITYVDATFVALSPEKLRVTLSEGLVWTFTRSTEGLPANLKFRASDPLGTRIKEIRFFLALVDGNELLVNGQQLVPEFGRVDEPAGPREHLGHLLEIEALLLSLNVNPDLVLYSDIKADDLIQLDQLRHHFVTDPATRGSDSPTGKVRLQLGKRSLLLLLYESETAGSMYVDPFSPNVHNGWCIQYGEGDKATVQAATAYELFSTPAEIANTLNLHLESAPQKYEAIWEDDGETGSLATGTVMRLLLAADTNLARCDEFLRGATRLNDWLLTKDPMDIAYLLNKFQIIWRQRPLTSSEQSDVRDIRRRALRAGGEFSALQEAGCELLLGNHAAFKEIFHHLTDEHQALFKTWPIWKLASDTTGPPSLEAAIPGR